jgi:hypothetical protein
VFATSIVKSFQFLLMSMAYLFTPGGRASFQLFLSLFPPLMLLDSLGMIVNLGLGVGVGVRSLAWVCVVWCGCVGLVYVSGDGL